MTTIEKESEYEIGKKEAFKIFINNCLRNKKIFIAGFKFKVKMTFFRGLDNLKVPLLRRLLNFNFLIKRRGDEKIKITKSPIAIKREAKKFKTFIKMYIINPEARLQRYA